MSFSTLPVERVFAQLSLAKSKCFCTPCFTASAGRLHSGDMATPGSATNSASQFAKPTSSFSSGTNLDSLMPWHSG